MTVGNQHNENNRKTIDQYRTTRGTASSRYQTEGAQQVLEDSFTPRAQWFCRWSFRSCRDEVIERSTPITRSSVKQRLFFIFPHQIARQSNKRKECFRRNIENYTGSGSNRRKKVTESSCKFHSTGGNKATK